MHYVHITQPNDIGGGLGGGVLMVQTQKHPPNPPQGGNSILAS